MALRFAVRRWQDQAILLLGAWLMFSPSVFGIPNDSPQAINAYVAGLGMAILALFDLYKTYLWAVVANLLLGAWIAVSPWVPAFADAGAMMSNSVLVGSAVVVLALWELRRDPELHRQWAGT